MMRLDYASVVPAARTAMLMLEKVVHDSDLNPRLVELVKIRASQINGCARCLEMHTKDARALGEEQDRLDLVATWPEAGCFSEQERAALAWCEALTLIAQTGAPDAVYDDVANHFEPRKSWCSRWLSRPSTRGIVSTSVCGSRLAATSPANSEDRGSVDLAGWWANRVGWVSWPGLTPFAADVLDCLDRGRTAHFGHPPERRSVARSDAFGLS
ncbi:MAG: carboxymuconolactone decarboxylase family protein [Acidimicrobiia bacterium]